MPDLLRIFDDLLALFNAQSRDLPDGVIDNRCVLRLNGRAYHEHLGRPPTDPIVRLVGCGPAGYRFVLGGLRHALGRPRLVPREPVRHERGADGGAVLTCRATLHGALRGGPREWQAECAVQLRADPNGRVREVAVTIGDADLEQLLAARTRQD